MTLNLSARGSISTVHSTYAADFLSQLIGKDLPMLAGELALTAISSRPTVCFIAGIESQEVLISGHSPGWARFSCLAVAGAAGKVSRG